MKRIFFFIVLPMAVNAQTVETIAGDGTRGYMGDGHAAISAEFNWPTSVRFDHLGNMYIADWINNVIREINTSGTITTVAGNGYGAGMIGVGGYTGDNGPATAAELNGPTDIAFDIAGNMYIADNSNAVIRKVNALGIITTIAGTGTIGYNGDGMATNCELNAPVGLAFDTASNLYFSDEGNYRVRKINTSGMITTIAGTGTLGYNGDEIPATAAQLRQPALLAFSASGDLYVPDWTEHRVRKIDRSGIITTVAGNGMTGNAGDGMPATVARISGCSAVIFDANGNFFISNNVSCSIRKVDATGIISTVIGNDTCGYSGDAGLATLAQIGISAVCNAIDASGNLYFADQQNNRIRRITYNAESANEINKTLQNAYIYPNPAHNEITIKTTDKIESIEILNLIGQEVASPRPSPGEREVLLNVSFLANGVYFVKVNGVYVGKFVKE